MVYKRCMWYTSKLRYHFKDCVPWNKWTSIGHLKFEDIVQRKDHWGSIYDDYRYMSCPTDIRSIMIYDHFAFVACPACHPSPGSSDHWNTCRLEKWQSTLFHSHRSLNLLMITDRSKNNILSLKEIHVCHDNPNYMSYSYLLLHNMMVLKIFIYIWYIEIYIWK